LIRQAGGGPGAIRCGQDCVGDSHSVERDHIPIRVVYGDGARNAEQEDGRSEERAAVARHGEGTDTSTSPAGSFDPRLLPTAGDTVGDGMQHKGFAVALVVAFVVIACSGGEIAARPAEPLDFLIEEDVPYTAQLTADVYYPDGGGPWPVAVVLHGGEDHKSTMSGYGRAAARAGVVAVVPEWRSFPAQLDEHRLAALEDVACAIRFARDRASDYGGDGERIVMAGWSLGANFATIATLDNDPIDGDCLVGADVSAAAHGVVGLDGVYDFAELILDDQQQLAAIEADPPPSASWTMVELNEISAHSYVQPADGDDPPVFRLFTGQVEELHLQAEQFQEQLRMAGYDVELVRQDGLSHMGVIMSPGTVEALADLAFES
jgi:acetyl esterase/lipase